MCGSEPRMRWLFEVSDTFTNLALFGSRWAWLSYLKEKMPRADSVMQTGRDATSAGAVIITLTGTIPETD
jgi:hypothetical protein